MALDLNRGVKTKFHPSGMSVNMYLDDPGVYLTASGDPMDAELAKQAGFDLERMNLERVKQLKLKAYREQLDRELQSEEDNLAAAFSQSDKHDVRHIGGGQYAVFDKDGKRVTKVAMSKADVELLVGKLPESE